MSDYKAPVEDILFLLNEVFDLEGFCAEFPELDDMDRETSRAIVDEAAKLCEQVIAPINSSGDEHGASWKDGEVIAPKGFKDAYQMFNQNAWGALGGHPSFGGMGMPKTLVSTVEEMLQGANMAFGLAPMLTAGACLSISAHASEEIKALYLPKMYSGQWAGTMALTESHAGTDLGLMRAKAEPNDDGSFRVTGGKIFITWGEHDMTENIVHLVLAKLPDAPEGSKGISLFLVPKFIPDMSGNPGERNSLGCGSIEEKMGIHGSPTCVMNFDGATGWLVGEPHKGLACMFTMMNYERLVVGVQGLGVAESSYQSARDYALERRQGRSKLSIKSKEPSPIIDHQDVRRMLLDAKCLNEAGRAFYIYVAQWLDRVKFSKDEQEKSLAAERVALLTPVVKSFLTDRSFDVCVSGQQVFGGHGYIREWGQEQNVRDVRITQIYEGTNGVQAMDFVVRKTLMCKGAMLASYIEEMRAELSGQSAVTDICEIKAQFEAALNIVESTTAFLVSSDDAELAGASAVDYLNLVGYVSYAYMWFKQLSALDLSASNSFTSSKKKTAAYFFAKVLPMIRSLDIKVRAGADLASAFNHEEF